jgi:gamma-glutamylcyclotransferase (GGCT)/AIG2-like uncharacterized protein YtfP
LELYFGYGANLNSNRFAKLNMRFEEIGSALLVNHEIDFSLPTEYKHKSYAGVHEKAGESVPGVLVKLDSLSLRYLDVLEWCGFGAYKRVKEDVSFNGKIYQAWVYKVNWPDHSRYPSKIYLNNMISAAESRSFPKEYIEKLKATEYREEFSIDPYFSLATYSSSRSKNKFLLPIYKVHDKIREKLCSII